MWLRVYALVVLLPLLLLTGCGAGIGPSYWGLTTLQVGLAQ